MTLGNGAPGSQHHTLVGALFTPSSVGTAPPSLCDASPGGTCGRGPSGSVTLTERESPELRVWACEGACAVRVCGSPCRFCLLEQGLLSTKQKLL